VGVPVWLAVRPASWSLSVSQGKGLTPDLAKISALMESIELAHAERFDSPGLWDSIFAHKKDARFLPPAALPLRSGFTLEDSPTIKWVPARAIRTDAERFVPFELINLDARRTAVGPFLATSNGLASGNTFAEAALHSICEVVERDQVSFWSVGASAAARPRNSEVALSTIDDGRLGRLIRMVNVANLDLRVWYATTNVRLPVFVALVQGATLKDIYPIRSKGQGAHPLKAVALSRAITEALQSRLTYISGSRDDKPWRDYPLSMSRNVAVGWDRRDQFVGEPIDYGSIDEFVGEVDTPAMLDWTIDRLLDAKVEEPVIVDLTTPEYQVPVVWSCFPNQESYGLQRDYLPGDRMGAYVNSLDC
jgi:ribosomal protein S12 methylthiotransferase accessory factor